MLTLNKIKFIKSLDIKKYRHQNNCFIVEGEKMVAELLNSKVEVAELLALQPFISRHGNLVSKNTNVTVVNEKELKKISNLKTPNQVVAVANIPGFNADIAYADNLAVALDDIQDPGNLGTIIRTANWFGIKQVFCSNDSVDAYNSKVIQSTMGAIFRTQVIYSDLGATLKMAKQSGLPIYGTVIDGSDIYKTKLSKKGIIVMGNESKGISSNIQKLLDFKLRIPDYPMGGSGMESLNVGIANAIVLSEFRRYEK